MDSQNISLYFIEKKYFGPFNSGKLLPNYKKSCSKLNLIAKYGRLRSWKPYQVVKNLILNELVKISCQTKADHAVTDT